VHKYAYLICVIIFQSIISILDFPFIINLSRKCLRCLCHAATGCNLTLGCVKGYCGPFKISRIYWIDAGNVTLPEDDPERAGAYEDCSINYNCAQNIVANYMLKYGRAKNQETTILGDSCSSQTIQNFVDVKTDFYRYRTVESSGVVSFLMELVVFEL
ncbi:hypothetical protein NQ317_012548, partial [Molorchus minor]